jgi:hypothetical protein
LAGRIILHGHEELLHQSLDPHEDERPIKKPIVVRVKERLMKGDNFAGRRYRAHLDNFGTSATTVRSLPPVGKTGRSSSWKIAALHRPSRLVAVCDRISRRALTSPGGGSLVKFHREKR